MTLRPGGGRAQGHGIAGRETDQASVSSLASSGTATGSSGVRKLVDGLRYIILATWGVYPLAYIAPSVIDDAATAEVVRQVGYSVADVLAKPLFGLLVLAIAIAKSREDGYSVDGTPEEPVAVPDDASELTDA